MYEKTQVRTMANSGITYQQLAYEHIRDKIINIKFKPGEYINDMEIATELNVSRTPVREAFYRLEKEGLLTNEARRGWRVYTLTLNDIHEIFDIKEAVEGMIARKAASCEEEHLRSKLRAFMDDMRAAAGIGDTTAWLKADIGLHEVIFDMAGNERAIRIVTNLNDQWHRLRIGFTTLQGRTKRSVDEHEAFICAILDGDGDSAEKYMCQHLNRVRTELVQLLVNLILPFVDEGV
jgi:DNA-binding GntR family transcriptional regulator